MIQEVKEELKQDMKSGQDKMTTKVRQVKKVEIKIKFKTRQEEIKKKEITAVQNQLKPELEDIEAS